MADIPKTEPTESEVEDGKVIQVFNKSNEQNDQKGPLIKRGRVDAVSIYEVTDYELGLLEQGSPNSVKFNVAIALLSIFATLIITFSTAEIGNPTIFIVLLILTVVCFVVGVILLLLWYSSSTEVRRIFKKIRNRIKD